MVKAVQIDWVRVGTAVAAALLLAMFWWVVVSLLVQP